MKIRIIEEKTNSWDKYQIYYENESIGWGDMSYDVKGKLGLQINSGKSNLFFDYSLNDLKQLNSTSISLPIDSKKFTSLDWMDVQSVLVLSMNSSPYLYVRPNVLKWDKLIGIEEFAFSFKKALTEIGGITSDFDKLHPDDLYFGFNLSIDQTNENIGFLYNYYLELINKIANEVFVSLLNSPTIKSIIQSFKFPPEIQSSCEQYLIYFSRFLSDLGIKATTNITSKTNETLFTITPENSKEALKNIKSALDIYLNLPNVENIEIVTKEYKDVSVQQLFSNIYHLKSQLLLANATIQLKDSTIANYKIALNKDLWHKNENQEKVLGGIISVDQFEWKGIKLNLAELLRRLQRKKI